MQSDPNPSKDNKPGLPTGTSVSATFMSFMQPIFDELGSNRQAWGALAKVASTVWNSVVLDNANGTRYLDEVRRLVSGSHEAHGIDVLIRRKLGKFAAHQWLVGHWEFYDDAGGNPRLRVEARAVVRKAEGNG